MIARQPINGPSYISRLKWRRARRWPELHGRRDFNSMPIATFAQNNGVIQLTGVASRYVAFLLPDSVVAWACSR